MYYVLSGGTIIGSSSDYNEALVLADTHYTIFYSIK